MPNSDAATASLSQSQEAFPASANAPVRTRWFLLALLAVTIASLVPMVILGRSEFISYDGYWHLFIDSQDRWRLFLSTYRGDAHPLLYHLVLRVLSRFGHSHLWYRSASILPGAACVYLM
jgi:hypothetical protein